MAAVVDPAIGVWLVTAARADVFYCSGGDAGRGRALVDLVAAVVGAEANET